MFHSFSPFQFYLRKILYPCYFSPVAFTPRKVIKHVTSGFDVCDVDLDMQISFLNAACTIHALGDAIFAAKWRIDVCS